MTSTTNAQSGPGTLTDAEIMAAIEKATKHTNRIHVIETAAGEAREYTVTDGVRAEFLRADREVPLWLFANMVASMEMSVGQCAGLMVLLVNGIDCPMAKITAEKLNFELTPLNAGAEGKQVTPGVVGHG